MNGLIKVLNIISASVHRPFNLPLVLLVSITMIFVAVAIIIFISTTIQIKHRKKKQKEYIPPKIIKIKDRYGK